MAAPDSSGISSDTQNFVVSLGEIEELRKKYEIENSLKLVCLRKTKNFGKNTEVCKKTISIRWNDSTGTVRNESMPYVLQGTYELGCMFGRDKHAKDKRRRQQHWERQLMEEVNSMDVRQLRDVLCRTIELDPRVMLEVLRPAVRQPGGYHPEHGGHFPYWCVCGLCREMTTQAERKCCGRADVCHSKQYVLEKNTYQNYLA